MKRIHLDSVRKYRNQNEWRPVSRATCDGYEEVGDGEIIGKICRRMSADGLTGQVEVWRGETLCFAARDISVWASGKALTGEQPEHLRRGLA